MLGAEIGHRIGHGTRVGGIAVGICEERRQACQNFLRCRQRPLYALVERWNEDLLVLHVDDGAGFACCGIENRLRTGPERLALRYPDRLEHVDHRLIAREPWLGLHEAIE